MRVVVDSNVLISAAITSGPANRLVEAWLEAQPYELVICTALLGEVEIVLTERDDLRRWISVEDAALYVERLRTTAEIRDDPPHGPPLTRDRDDDFVVYLARQHEADLIVSGDRDLLEWPGQDPPVVTPRQFVELLHEG